MPRSRQCDYCGGDIEPGTGTMFVRINGQTVHFCSSKCEKNADLGREARDLEWTAAGRGPDRETAEPGEVAPSVEADDESEGGDESVEADDESEGGDESVEADDESEGGDESEPAESESDEETEEAQA